MTELVPGVAPEPATISLRTYSDEPAAVEPAAVEPARPTTLVSFVATVAIAWQNVETIRGLAGNPRRGSSWCWCCPVSDDVLSAAVTPYADKWLGVVERSDGQGWTQLFDYEDIALVHTETVISTMLHEVSTRLREVMQAST